VESRNFRSRKSVLEYDNVMNTQREVIYAQRQKVLDGEDLRENMMSMLRGVVDSTVADVLSKNGGVADTAIAKEVYSRFAGIYFPKNSCELPQQEVSQQELADTIYEKAAAFYDAKEQRYTPAVMRELERVIMLRVVDEYWMDNIDAMDDLKQGIGLRSYGQHDPVIAYKEEGYQMFQAMVSAIRDETVRRMFTVQLRPQQELKREQVAKETGTSGDAIVKKQPVRKSSEQKIGPNDPCPCGSGKKYKKCCMQKDKAADM
jgi:preprotein translocase subunit SecA